MKSFAVLICTLSISLSAPVLAGGPTEAHPCYAVADCKTKAAQPEFSACIKAHQAEADALPACAEFRKDKDAYMKAHGIANLGELFTK
jgi:hypothetical protein